jgi:AcrR family transcriptional regulator
MYNKQSTALLGIWTIVTTVMRTSIEKKNNHSKKEDILKAAFRLFTENGYEKTSVRQLVDEANTSMGNLYYHFPNKRSILKYICSKFVDKLRDQIHNIHEMNFNPELGFALDFRIGYLATLEDPTFSQIFTIARNIPDIQNHSDELDYMAIAIQGIADAIFEQKRTGMLKVGSEKLSTTIIEYSLRLLGFDCGRIKEIIKEADKYIKEKHITPADYFNFPKYQ